MTDDGGSTGQPPGWYDDGRGAQRWWDGVRWTEQVLPAPPSSPPPGWTPGEQPAPARRSRRLLLGVAAVLVLVLVAGGLGVVLVVGSDDGPAGPAATGDAAPNGVAEAQAALRGLAEGAQDGDCDALDVLDEASAATIEPDLCEWYGGTIFFGTIALDNCQLAFTDAGTEGAEENPPTIAVGYTLTGCYDTSREQDESVDVQLRDGEWRVIEVPGFLEWDDAFGDSGVAS